MRRIFILIGVLLMSLPPARGDERVIELPGDGQPRISADRFEQISEGKLLLTGDVDLRYQDMRILADEIEYDDAAHMAHATGNVVMMFGRSQISGDRLEVDLATRMATIWNAHGYMEPDMVFEADKLERIAEDKVVITNGTVSTCTQPTPYWAFHVSKATLHKDHYAFMHNVSFRVKKAPVLYIPFLAWPMKRDRASGLLLPNVGFSRRRGSFIGNELYLVLGRSQDLSLLLAKFGQSGTGTGFNYRFVPAEAGEGRFSGFYIQDQVDDPISPGAETNRTRYRFNFHETQSFKYGYRLLADLNVVSDFDYFLDFERDIRQTTSPTIFSHIDLVRNWSNYSLNVRLERQEQFITSDEEATLQRLPEMEFRGHGVRFGRTPIYLSFISSLSVFNKGQRTTDPTFGFVGLESTYQRVDLFPTISASFTPVPWLDISPSFSTRGTYYSRTLEDPNSRFLVTSGADGFRSFESFNLAIVGPRFYRLYGDLNDDTKPRYKHTFEPRLNYTFIPEVSGESDIIRFDEVDSVAGDIHQMAYSVTSRLFAKRPSREPKKKKGAGPPPPTDAAGPTQVEGPLLDLKSLPDEIKAVLADRKRSPAVGTVEIASFDVTQVYSFDHDKPFRNLHVEPDGTTKERTSPAGPIVGTLRYNPTPQASLDLRLSYDTFNDDLDTVSLSTNLRSLKYGYIRASWFLNRDLDGRSVRINPFDPNSPLTRDVIDTSQVRLLGGTAFLNRKITFDFEGSYDIENRDLQDQRYRFGYNTQCCGIMMEVARRDFDTIDEIEYRFTLNLRGVGTFLDLQGTPQ
ncbi:MAG: LPS-assembly protein LptD [Acidobacteriota bacterium]